MSILAVRGSDRQERGIPSPLERSAPSKLHREQGLFFFGGVVLFALAQPCAAAPIQLTNQNIKHPPRLLFPKFPASQMTKSQVKSAIILLKRDFFAGDV